MKHIKKTFVLVFLLIIGISFISCAHKRKLNLPKTNLSSENLIPKPVELVATHTAFPLDQFTAIETPLSEDFKQVGKFLSKKIKEQTGLELKVNPTKKKNIETIIRLEKVKLATKNPEEYELHIGQDSIIVNAATATGAFRGIQTLQQLIPNANNDTIADHKIWIIPSGKISDFPQFEYRGVMLDVARHFFSVADVKKFIDILSYYKINILHLHLTDDQGWRIEIKSWPKLTEIGGQTEVDGKSGGFYTQDEYSKIVHYAAKRHITIIPEIDMPGHTNAASLSYPFLNGNSKKLKPYEGTGVGFSTFNTRKDTVYTFIDDVIREVAALSPGSYFHIGGDESHSTKKNDYNYFITKVQKIIKRYDKKMIGWDEIANTDIANGSSVAQFWNNKKNTHNAVKKGMKIIISPAKKAYLDMKYDKNTKLGLDWAAHIPVDTAYNWSPETYAEIPIENILGVEAPLWGETISNIDELEYLAFPRAIGYAELGWTALKDRKWEDYKVRLANQAPFLERKNVNFYRSPLIDWKK